MPDKTTTTTEPCDCDNGRVWLGEQAILDELRAEEGTGRAVSFTFGFGGPERTWRACDKCGPAKAKAELRAENLEAAEVEQLRAEVRELAAQAQAERAERGLDDEPDEPTVAIPLGPGRESRRAEARALAVAAGVPRAVVDLCDALADPHHKYLVGAVGAFGESVDELRRLFDAEPEFIPSEDRPPQVELQPLLCLPPPLTRGPKR